MLTKLTSNELSIIQSNNGLQRYLESLLKGKTATPRSWLYEQTDTNDILSNWKKQLQTLEKGSEFELNVFQFDALQEAKWGPQGEVAPISELMGLVQEGFGTSPVPSAFKHKLWSESKAQLTRLLVESGVRGLRPASYQRVVDDMRARDTLESNSGWPLFTRRSKPEVKKSSIQDAESGAWKDYPAIALFRNYNQKTRLVWMFPMAANLVEGSYFQPLQSALMNRGFRFLTPWVGFDSVRRVVTQVYESGDFVASSDFSSTDAHFTRDASLEVYDVIAPLFQARFRDGLRESLEHMHEIPLVVGPDEKLDGLHGVSSGSNWTNFIETIFDWIFSIYVSRSTASGYSGLYAIGDDMAWVGTRYNAELSTILEQSGKEVGQVIQASKATNDRDRVTSLQRLFQRGYSRPDGDLRAVYPTIRALKSSVFPERFHDPRRWSKDMFCARQYMILENCVDHPLFEEFVRFVVRGNEHLQPFAMKSKSELERILRESKLLPGLNPTYNQERRDSSLAAFESIRIASSL